jgi:hypothetical protein
MHEGRRQQNTGRLAAIHRRYKAEGSKKLLSEGEAAPNGILETNTKVWENALWDGIQEVTRHRDKAQKSMKKCTRMFYIQYRCIEG